LFTEKAIAFKETFMKSFDELTYLGKVRRFRQLAGVALKGYGLAESRFKLLRVAGNILFRVYDSTPKPVMRADSYYEEGQYLLRIHDHNEQPTDAIKLEMEWLAAICREAGLPVPQPVPNLDSSLLSQVSTPGIPGKRDCTLLRWLKGRLLSRGIGPCHYKAQGRLMAQLHNHAQSWQPPQDLAKRRFDWVGLFEDDAGAGFPNAKAWPLLPRRYLEPFKLVSQKVKRVMRKWGMGPEVYGLIHADCGVDANVLFQNGEARIIDFDGSGFGYYIYDLALALEHCWDEDDYPRHLKALLDGYTEYRLLTDEQLLRMDLFLAAFYVYMGLWTAACDQVYPDSKNGPYRRQRWQDRGLKFITRRLERKLI
jgi:Ser/Thr protein kinase RdoA (MazF antagonist)